MTEGLTITFPAEVNKDLVALKNELRLGTVQEVFEFRLNLLEWVLRHRKDGRKITAYKFGSKVIHLKLPGKSNMPNGTEHYKECPEHEDYNCPNQQLMLGCLDGIIYDNDGNKLEDCEEGHECTCEDIEADIEADAADDARNAGLHG